MLGLGLIMLLMGMWLFMNQPTEAERLEIERRRDSLSNVENKEPIRAENSGEDTMDLSEGGNLSQDSGLADSVVVQEEEIVTLENENMEISFSTKGGRMTAVLLKNYKKVIEDAEKEEIEVPLRLLEDEKDRFEYLFSVNGQEISSQNLFFAPSKSNNKISFRAPVSGGGYIEQIYELVPESFQVRYEVRWDGIPDNRESVTLNWLTYLDKLEKNTTFERTYSTIHYKPSDSRATYTSYTRNDDKEITKPVKWVSHSNQFFNSTLLANQSFPEVDMAVTTMDQDNADLKKLQTKFQIPNQTGSNIFQMDFYIGPNDYKNLKPMGHELEDIIPFGWSIFGTINRRVIRPLFMFLDGFVGSKGVSIILLTLLVKLALYPITYRMLYSQAKTQALKPRMDKLKEKFKGDQQKIQMETMKLYQEYGVNPVGGCLPMVLQMPIWFALYRFFPASIEFRQAGFWWVNDLSSYDAFFILPFEIPMLGGHISLFTILYTISMIAYTYYNSKIMTQPTGGNEEMMKMMKFMQYGMPLMFFFFFNNYASGLTAYLFFSNLMTIAQTVVTKNFIIDHEKIDRELDAYKEKPKKTSKFRERLNDAIKEQQRQQELRDKQKK